MAKEEKKKKGDESAKPIPPSTMNSNHIMLCNMLADPEYRLMTKTAMAEKMKISRQTLYKYLERKDVRTYTTELVEYFTDGELGNVWKSLVNTCKKGNVNAIRLYFEMKRMYTPPNQVTELMMKDASATINVISNIPRPQEGADEEDK